MLVFPGDCSPVIVGDCRQRLITADLFVVVDVVRTRPALQLL